MSWIQGTIVKFPGNNPDHRELRKVKTEPDQKWEHMYFLRLELGRRAGYPEPELADGKTIEFKPDPNADRPRVLELKPFGAPARQLTPALPAGANEFHNPYHFLPLVPPPQGTLEPVKPLLEQNTFHDRFSKERFTGRIVCRVTTEGPMVIGGRQVKPPDGEKRETAVEPFTLPDPENPGARRPAIPASTLRGLISNLFEAATGSAMRVLPEKEYSRREDYQGEALSAVGMVVDRGGKLELLPLTLSIRELTTRADGPSPPKPEEVRCFVNAYRRAGNRQTATAGTFLATPGLRSHSHTHQSEFYYADLSAGALHWSQTGNLCLGRMLQRAPLTQAQFDALPASDRGRFTRGILQVFGLGGSKADNLPPTKKHEYFIPFPPGREKGATYPISAEALEEFAALAEESKNLPRGGMADDYPYLPEGRDPLDEKSWLPREGDLVYFEKNGGSVTRISFSAVWRRRVNGSLHGAVRKVHEDLVPFDQRRQQVTLAEQVFGFVEQRGDKGEEGARALAGRVRFSHGLACGDASPEAANWYLFSEARTLKILASPKPPSPALYFGLDKYLRKKDLDLTKQRPAGRKVYLHHQDPRSPQFLSQETDETKRHLKLRVNPIRPDVSFLFHVDFQNLTRTELSLLCFALRPSDSFSHKLGLGKPLGLGTVRLDPVVLAFVDPAGRYTVEGLFGPKYAGVDGGLNADNLETFLKARYRHERSGFPGSPADERFPKLTDLLQEGRGWVRGKVPAVADALDLIGDPAQVRAPVTYPLTTTQQGEGEHFKWFVANERLKSRHRDAETQVLKPLRASAPLPVLRRLPPAESI